VNFVKSVLFTAGAFVAAAVMYYLYQRQLGAIPFFILSIAFFLLAYGQLKKRTKAGKGKVEMESEKSRRNGR
jgi:uncharacterized membrane protein YfcA